MSLRGLRAVGPLCRAVGRASSTSILETAPESEELISALHCVQTMLAALGRSNPTSNQVCRCEVPSTAYAACQDRDALTLRDSRPQPRSLPIAQGSRAHWSRAVEVRRALSRLAGFCSVSLKAGRD